MDGAFIVFEDGRASTSNLTAKEWLLASPTGAYTAARTCAGGTRLFEWDTHVRRTAASAAAMLSDASHAVAAPPEAVEGLLQSIGTEAALRPLLDASVAAAVRAYQASHPGPGELKITVLVSWQSAGSSSRASVRVHVAPLPPLPRPPVRVEVRGAPRSNALAKDASWVFERAPLEALLRPDFNEQLLASADGEILEGSQTNFALVQGGTLFTAGEGVLAGTVRGLLLKVCEREGVPVVLRAPRLDECSEWDAALISSTSSLLLPVDELYVPSEGQRSSDSDLRRRFDYSSGASLAVRLRDWVQREVEAHSVEIPASD